jgi:hypothetical protein
VGVHAGTRVCPKNVMVPLAFSVPVGVMRMDVALGCGACTIALTADVSGE